MTANDVIKFVKNNRALFNRLINRSMKEKREFGFRIFKGFEIGSVRRGKFKSIKLDNSVIRIVSNSGTKMIGSFHVHRKQRGGVDALSPLDLVYNKDNECKFALIGFKNDKINYVKIFYFKRLMNLKDPCKDTLIIKVSGR